MSSLRRNWRGGAWIAGLVALWPALVVAADNVLSPLDLVDSRVGACVEARGLKARWSEVRDSAWGVRWRASQLFASWKASDPARKVERSSAALEKFSGRPTKDILADLFGRHIVVAVYPRDAGDPEGILITETASEEFLADAISLWNRAETQETDSLRHRGIEYFRRSTIRDGRRDKSIYYVRFGTLFALSDRESRIQHAIDLSLVSSPGEADRVDLSPLSIDAEFLAAQQTLSADNFVRAFVQPQLLWHGKSEDSRDAPEWARGWLRCRSISAGLRFDEGWVIESTARFPEEASSDRWKEFVEASRGEFPFLKRVPDDALAVVAGHVDFSQAGRFLHQIMTEKDRKEFAQFRQVARGLLLGRDLVSDVLPSLGPGFVGYVVPRRPAEKSEFPWNAVAAWSLRRPPADPSRPNAASLHAGLDNALHTGLNVLAAMRNADKPDAGATARSNAMEDSRDKGGPLRWVEGLGPVAPAFAARADLLGFASSPDPLRQFLSGDPEKSLKDADWFQSLTKRHFRGGQQAMVIHIVAVRRSLEENREKLVGHAMRRESMSENDAERRLNDVLDVLNLADAAFLTADLRPHEIRLTLGAVLPK